MKGLKEINFLKKIYGEDLSSSEKCKTLFNKIKPEENPWHFKQEILGIIQLYFDGLIEKKFELHLDNKNLRTLEELCLAGKNYIGKFYKGNGKDMNKEKEIILSNKKNILKESYNTYSNMSHLSREEKIIIDSIPFLEKNIVQYLKNNKIETIVPITSEGFEPSFLIANIFERGIILPIRYSRGDFEDNSPKEPYSEDYKKKNLQNKNVLIVEGTAISGESLHEMIKFVKIHKPKKLFGFACRSEDLYCLNNSDKQEQMIAIVRGPENPNWGYSPVFITVK